MENTKKLKRGEFLFKEGEPVTSLYLIQSGKISLVNERGGKHLEIGTLGGSQVIGEAGLFSNARHPFSGEAQQETRYFEMPIEFFKQQLEKGHPGIKLMVKSLSDDVRQARVFMKNQKAETEKVPCPQGMVHRIFTELHLTLRHLGKVNVVEQNQLIVSWGQLKLYVTRFFGQSPQRLRSLMDLLIKLKMLEATSMTSEEGETDLDELKFSNIQTYEDFAEFYQYHLFKGSKADAIYVDALALKVARAFYELSEGAPVDHKGGARVDFTKLSADIKEKYNFEVKPLHLESLERKGLFVKRQTGSDGLATVIFDRTEFGKTVKYWSILVEIDKWNEKGFVDLNEKDPAAVTGPRACSQCQTVLQQAVNFCPNCGLKMAA